MNWDSRGIVSIGWDGTVKRWAWEGTDALATGHLHKRPRIVFDITPEEKRTKYNAILSMVSLFGQVALGLFAIKLTSGKHHIPDLLFYATAGIAGQAV